MKTDEEIAIAEPFNRLNDAYFKSVMASSERKHITIAFLNAVMSHVYSDGHPEIDDVEFLDREAVSVWEVLKSRVLMFSCERFSRIVT
ncbi:MAG: hypothetical protein II832_10505 [Synergistaceae bacterium]|nr:hypothetical protein [Synergistaceae bacterium]